MEISPVVLGMLIAALFVLFFYAVVQRQMVQEHKVSLATRMRMYSEMSDANTKLSVDVTRLKMAINAHANARGHDRCWHNDLELYKIADLPVKDTDYLLPNLPEFAGRCMAYWQDRQPKKKEESCDK